VGQTFLSAIPHQGGKVHSRFSQTVMTKPIIRSKKEDRDHLFIPNRKLGFTQANFLAEAAVRMENVSQNLG